ncbi:MAG: DALR domain-containing protein, partial [Pseudonocardiaceae bacterium]
DVAAALDDDLNAPRAVAALFSFMGAGNAALDGGLLPGPKTVAAWDRADGVLGVAGEVTAIKVTADAALVDGGPDELSESAPGEGEAAQQVWAHAWAVRRKRAKTGRDFAEADRIRDRLKAAGWEVRDGRDGSVEVVRTGR